MLRQPCVAIQRTGANSSKTAAVMAVTRGLYQLDLRHRQGAVSTIHTTFHVKPVMSTQHRSLEEQQQTFDLAPRARNEDHGESACCCTAVPLCIVFLTG